MIHILTCECGHTVDVAREISAEGQRILEALGAPRCFHCHRHRMREAWLADHLFEDPIR